MQCRSRSPHLCKWLHVGVVVLGGWAWFACGESAPPERIVLIVIDTLRRDHVSAYGGDVATPHIDALAERGQRFDRALASFHQTSMSMASLFTGRTPSIESLDPKRPLHWNGSTWCGMSRLASRDEGAAPAAAGERGCIPPSLPTLGEQLRKAGYWTIGIASSEFLFRPAGFDVGFDDWIELGREEGKGPDAVPIWVPDEKGGARPRLWKLVTGQRVNAAAFQTLARRKSDRFFLYVHYMDVHDYEFRRVPYAATVAAVDRAVGALLAGLEGQGLLEGTVILLTADHGENLGEGHGMKGGANHLGNPSFSEVLEVPLIVSPVVPLLRGREMELVRSQDVYSWIQEIAGTPPSGRDGTLGPDELFIGEQKFRTYRRGRWKSSMRRRDGRFYLFDLEADPGERRDVAGQHPDVIRSHLVRVSEIARALRSAGSTDGRLSERDRERLRLLGYLEPDEPSP